MKALLLLKKETGNEEENWRHIYNKSKTELQLVASTMIINVHL